MYPPAPPSRHYVDDIHQRRAVAYEPRPAPVRLRDASTVRPIHIILFLTTLLTTTMAGTFLSGANPFSEPLRMVRGLPFSLTLMSILLTHEMGHFLVARLHGVAATPPFFIPGPPFLIGTFGAFIRMQAPTNRRALFDVGAAGPWAGFFVAVPAVLYGLTLSTVGPLPLEQEPGGLLLGDSLVFMTLARMALDVSPSEVMITLHPVALAGWFGLFVTFLNLLPVGQLDGGHVVYALLGRFHRMVARAGLMMILGLALLGWPGWLIWAVLVVMIGLDHPPTLDDTPLDPARRVAAWLTIGLFIACFMPVPIEVAGG